MIEKRGAQLVARIYPMNRTGETTFFHPGGEASKIRVSATHRSVTTDSGKHPAAALQRGVLEFTILPGVNHDVR